MTNETSTTVRKNAREEIRIGVQEYRGQQVAGIRIWFNAADGTMRPGKDGIAFRADLLPQVAEAVNRALEQARARGLIEG